MKVTWFPARITGPRAGIRSTPSTVGWYRTRISTSRIALSTLRDRRDNNASSGRSRHGRGYRPVYRNILPRGVAAHAGFTPTPFTVDTRYPPVSADVPHRQ